MASDYFIESYHEESRRHAVVELEGPVVYLYLTESGAQRPARDIAVFSVAPLVDVAKAREAAEQGQPPPLSRQHASAVAIQPATEFEQLAVVWAADGHGAAVTLRGEPWAFASADARQGYSRAIAKAGWYGNPWSDEEFLRRFGR